VLSQKAGPLHRWPWNAHHYTKLPAAPICFADVAGDGSEAGEHGDFFGREGVQFLQTGDDRDAGRLAETRVAVCIAMYYY
jgi:hypothetical protein